MLGRSAGLTEAKLRHIGDESEPGGVYEPWEWAIVEYAQRSTRMEPITDDLYGRLAERFSQTQIMELCFTVGMSNMINRFHSTFLTDVDPETNNVVAATCALPMADELRQRADQGWLRSST